MINSIIIIAYVISTYALKNNNVEDYIGELEKVLEVTKVGLFTIASTHPYPLKKI